MRTVVEQETSQTTVSTHETPEDTLGNVSNPNVETTAEDRFSLFYLLTRGRIVVLATGATLAAATGLSMLATNEPRGEPWETENVGLVLLTFPLVASGIERLIEMLFTWYESSRLAFGIPLRTGHASDSWPTAEVQSARSAVAAATDRLQNTDPSDPDYEAAWSALQTSAQRLVTANSHVESSLKNPQYVYQKKLVSMLASTTLGVLIATAFKIQLFTALGFVKGWGFADQILTGVLLGAGAGPAHGIIEGLLALRGIRGLGSPGKGYKSDRVEETPNPAGLASGIADLESAPLADYEADAWAEEAAEEALRAEMERDDVDHGTFETLALEELEKERTAPWLASFTLASTSPDADEHFGRGVIGMQNTSPEFRRKVVQICRRLGMKPLFLMAVMSFETGGRFTSDVRHPTSGATGLIQFMPSTARALGTTTAALARMDVLDQLDYVQKYFSPYRNRLRTLEDTYMAVLWPAGIGKSPGSAIFRRGTIAYRQNSGLDINRDGMVTIAEAAEKVRRRIL